MAEREICPKCGAPKDVHLSNGNDICDYYNVPSRGESFADKHNRGVTCGRYLDQFMTYAQRDAIRSLCERYKVTFDATQFAASFDLPSGWVAGWIGDAIYIGCSPEGDINS